ncbi:MAG: exosortase A [Halioglobus sp.]
MDTHFYKSRVSVRGDFWVAGLYCLCLVLIFHETAWSMVYIWSRSETFAHGFLIAPISVWLIWNRRDLLEGVAPQPVFWVALFNLPLGLAWLLAWLVDVAVIQQLALVAMLVTGVWAIVGHQLGRVIAFPLLFLFFAVPMGESLISPMMEFTATSTVWLIELTGIPVYREGLNFALPSGNWSVVEACSGVRYIIASVTVGTLYAYLTYRSWIRRVLFVLVSAIVPVFANTARAYLIVMLGHMSDMKIATGADHLIYGWVFFGLVIFLLFWLGAFFREDHLAIAVGKEAGITRWGTTSGSIGILLLTLVTALSIASAAPYLARSVLAETNTDTRKSFLFPAAQTGWKKIAAPGWRWSPPSRVFGQQFAYFERNGAIIGLFVQFADGTMEGADVVGSSALFARQDSGWRVTMQDKARANLPLEEFLVDEARLRGANMELLAWSWYLVGGESTSNDYQAKLGQALGRLGIGGSGAYRLVVVTPFSSSLEKTQDDLKSFLEDYIPRYTVHY